MVVHLKPESESCLKELSQTTGRPQEEWSKMPWLGARLSNEA